YGGSLENRYRILREILFSIQGAVPEAALAVRMPGQDFIEKGLTIDDSKTLARWMVRDGVAIIDVSSGLGGWRRPDTRAGQGYLVSEAAGIQSVIEAPVIGVGGI